MATRKNNGASPIASLASKATAQSATASKAKNDGKEKTNITGQFLFDTFVNDAQSAENRSKMAVIRNMVSSSTVDMVKKACSDMVEKAKDADKKAGIPEKEITKRGPKYRNAANAKSIIQKIYGALRFAGKEMTGLKYSDELGYHAASSIAKIALDKKGVRWDGTKGLTEEQKASAAHKRIQEKALDDVKASVLPLPTESTMDYYLRISEQVDSRVEEIYAEQASKKVNDQAEKLFTVDAAFAVAVANRILALNREAEKEAAKSAKEANKEAKAEADNKAESKAESKAE